MGAVAKVWGPPPVESVPVPCITILTDQVVTLQGEIAYLRQRLSDQEDYSSVSDDKGEAETTDVPFHEDHICYPDLEGQPCIHCALALDNLTVTANSIMPG
ncbi:hypothetical protein DSO57_1010959 [Entomophthora muscae]|uniref:Uncharacterized protein n=1 Tax=Entomophthora muscae TaxID=34485 RepID=A0ACC2THM8_9FUNG|nr:hypothetical protein DSO57_1010959 [Entomophthora muscae]